MMLITLHLSVSLMLYCMSCLSLHTVMTNCLRFLTYLRCCRPSTMCGILRETLLVRHNIDINTLVQDISGSNDCISIKFVVVIRGPQTMVCMTFFYVLTFPLVPT